MEWAFRKRQAILWLELQFLHSFSKQKEYVQHNGITSFTEIAAPF